MSCELLSNCIFIGFIDNEDVQPMIERFVVNCFQIVFLSGSLTTETMLNSKDKAL